MPGFLREHLLAALDAVDHRGDLRAVLDDHVALAAELVDDVLAGDLAGLDVVGLHRGVGARRPRRRPRRRRCRPPAPLDRRRDRLRVGGVEQDQVDAGGDEVVDLGELLVEVVVEPRPS